MPTPITQLAQKVLDSPAFRRRFNDVQVKTSKRRLSFNEPRLDEDDVKKLILQASVLALSENAHHRGMAQKINAFIQ